MGSANECTAKWLVVPTAAMVEELKHYFRLDVRSSPHNEQYDLADAMKINQ